MTLSTFAKLIIQAVVCVTTSSLSYAAYSSQNKLIVLSTFSKGSLEVLADTFEQMYPDVDVEFIYRRTQSSVKLLSRGNRHNIDLILTSSPLLVQRLMHQNKISPIEYQANIPDWLEKYVLLPPNEIDVFAYSGAGIVWNQDYLKAHDLPVPNSVIELANPIYMEHLTMSPPSRSGTSQLMLESILSKHGWEEGWKIVMNIGANLGTVSSRSFTVSDYIARGEFGLGITIDTHALLLQRNFDHLNFKYAEEFTLFPTYLAKLNKPSLNPSVDPFISMVHSKEFQTSLAQNAFSKTSLTDNSLHRDELPTLELSNMMIREELVNLIFDVAVTERLPTLRELWASILSLESDLQGRGSKNKLAHLKARLFSLPVSEADIQRLALQLQSGENQESAQNQLLTTKFAHNLNRQLRREMESIEQDIQYMKSANGLQQ
ncbi:ABC transporter substrate-binding protein [Vibrio sp. HN007]|uniref:ABC transporter substrate-binding protein n=1 Tax=Vibrio iocasae TaxID=3098914 RepID=UPI0035D4D336